MTTEFVVKDFNDYKVLTRELRLKSTKFVELKIVNLSEKTVYSGLLNILDGFQLSTSVTSDSTLQLSRVVTLSITTSGTSTKLLAMSEFDSTARSSSVIYTILAYINDCLIASLQRTLESDLVL